VPGVEKRFGLFEGEQGELYARKGASDPTTEHREMALCVWTHRQLSLVFACYLV